MRKTIILIILLSIITLFANVPTGKELLQVDDIIKYYELYDKIADLEANIDTLNGRCLCLETKIAVLEMAVENEVFYDRTIPCPPKADGDVIGISKGTNGVYMRYDDNKLTKEMHDNYNDVMEEIILLWEAIYKLEDKN